MLHVHDLVDNVSREAAIAGKNAARHAACVKCERTHYRVSAQNGVRYTVPQRICTGSEGDIPLMLRVGNVYRNAALVVSCQGEVIARRKKNIFTPGEMETITVDASRINGDITVELEVQNA